MSLAIRTWRNVFGTLIVCLLSQVAVGFGNDLTRPMSFRHLTVADGLSQHTIMDIHQDSVGYIWLATENGLDRYDGYTVTSYQRGLADNGQLVNDYIWTIGEDHDGNLWLATDGGGVAKWIRSTDRFEHYRHDPKDTASLSSDRTRTLLVTHAGVWVGTYEHGLNFIDHTTGIITRFRHNPNDAKSLPSDGVFALLLDDRNGLWVGTDRGLALLDIQQRAFTTFRHNADDDQSLSNDKIRALNLDQYGALWVGTFGGGLNVLHTDDFTVTRYRHDANDPASLSHDHVRGILEDNVGRMWIGTAHGLDVMAPGSAKFHRYGSGDGKYDLPDDYIMSLAQDRSGLLWIGTRTAGVSAWHSDSWLFGHYQHKALSRSSVTSFTTDQKDVWVGMFGGGLAKIDRRSGKFTTLELPLSRGDNKVMALAKDSASGLWVGTMSSGLYWRPNGRETFVNFRHRADDPKSLSGNGVMSIYEDRRGHIWVGTFGKGFSRFDPRTQQFKRYGMDEAPAGCGAQGRAFAEDRLRNFWVATEQGLCVIDPKTNAMTGFTHAPNDAHSLPENSVYALHRDTNGVLWAGTGGAGLARIDVDSDSIQHTTFATFSRKHGLSSNMVYGLLSDERGQLWLSGNNGLTRFNPQTLEVKIYRRTHGLQSDEFHFGAAHKSADGELFFGGSGGFNHFFPDRLNQSSHPPPVVVTKVLKANQPHVPATPLAELHTLELPYDRNAVSFEFAALDFTDPKNNRYRYKLEGFDTDWIDAGTSRSATYTNLDGGSYHLRVAASNSQGAWNEQGVDIALKVGSPPWQTPLAYFSYVIAAMFVFWRILARQNEKLAQEAAYRKRLEREVANRTEALEETNTALQRVSQAKGEFLARMSHELRSPINGVIGMADLLQQTQLSDKQGKFTETIAQSARSLLSIINDILDFSKLESEKMSLDLVPTNLEEIIDEVVEMFALQAHDKGIELTARIPPFGLPTVVIDPLRIRQVLVNLIGNAIKFTPQGHVAVTVEQTAEGTFTFAVADTGIGIAEESRSMIFDSFTQETRATARKFGGTGLGLSISKELVELMGGDLQLSSQVGRGTTFEFSLPLTSHEGPSDSREPLPELTDKPAIIAVNHRELARMIERYVAAWGMTVTFTHTQHETEAALNEHGEAALLFIDSRTEIDAPESAAVIHLNALDQSNDHRRNTLTIPPRRSELQELATSLAASKVAYLGSRRSSGQAEQLSGRVLLVEDNPVNRDVFVGMLETIGCESACAENGLTGVQLATSEHFDVVLMDYRLPDIDGVEATRRIRQAEFTQLPIIALTANASPEDRQRCLAAGMNDFLSKPCELAVLAAALEQWLPKSEPYELSFEPDEFDEGALEQIRSMQRPDGSNMLSHAATLFNTTADECLSDMRMAVDTQDARRLQSAAHKLKSACGLLGLSGMAVLCREIEHCGESTEFESVREQLTLLAQKHSVAERWLIEQMGRGDTLSQINEAG